MSTPIRIVLLGLLFAAVFVSGFWMWNTRKPVPGLKLNLHKFLSLAALVFSVLLVNDLRAQVSLSGPDIPIAAAAGVFFLLTIVSGGLVSLERPAPGAIKTFHRLGPFLTEILTAVLIYRLMVGV
jgi:hypothetical protein